MSQNATSPKILAAVAVAVVLLVGLVGWFGFVSPQHSKAKTLDTQIADAQAQLKVAKLLARSQRADKSKTSGLSLLNKAMPSELQMPSVLRQVQRLATLSDVHLNSFTPAGATPLDGYESVPISVSVTGRYTALQSFLHRLRVQAQTSGGKIHASGRLFDVRNVNLSPSELPLLTAGIDLTTFVYTGIPLAPATTTTTSDGTSATAAAEGTS